MPKQLSVQDERPFILSHTPIVLSLFAAAVLVGSSLLWWSKVHDNPHRVFKGMLENNLSTPSVTRETVTNDGTKIDKLEQLSFVPPVASRTLISINQTSPTGNNDVTSEVVGSLASDYSRYITINTSQTGSNGKPLDYSSIANVWGQTSLTDGPPQYFNQAFMGVVLFANLSGQDRHKIVDQLNNTKAYQVDFTNVKPKRLNGKSALVFPVKVDLFNYVSVIKAVAKASGAGDTSGLDPEQYKDQPAISLEITVDKHSRQVIEVSYGGQVEKYSSYGLSSPVQLPDKTIPLDDLKEKVRAIH